MRNVTIKLLDDKEKETVEVRAEEVSLSEVIDYIKMKEKMSSQKTKNIATRTFNPTISPRGRGPKWTLHDIMMGVDLLKNSPEARNGEELTRLIREKGDMPNRRVEGIRVMAGRLYHYLYVGDPERAGMASDNIEKLKLQGIAVGSMKKDKGISVPITHGKMYRKEYLPSFNTKES